MHTTEPPAPQGRPFVAVFYCIWKAAATYRTAELVGRVASRALGRAAEAGRAARMRPALADVAARGRVRQEPVRAAQLAVALQPRAALVFLLELGVLRRRLNLVLRHQGGLRIINGRQVQVAV